MDGTDVGAAQLELELKFQVPDERLEAVRRMLHDGPAQRTRLQAVYVDSPDRVLAGAGIALRVRREGDRWVQTLKARGDGPMARLEHNVVVGEGEVVPALDPGRHAGVPAGAALQAALKAAGLGHEALKAIFSTDVWRTHRQVAVDGPAGGVVELALDEGHLESVGRRLRLSELEYELVRGDPKALLALAAGGVEQHGLWLDIRTKAERGDALARGQVVPKVQRVPRALGAGPGTTRQAQVRAVLDQVLPNASALAAGLGGPDHLAALQEALQRLKPPAGVAAAEDRAEAWSAGVAGLVGATPAAAGAWLRAAAWNRLALQLVGEAHGAA